MLKTIAVILFVSMTVITNTAGEGFDVSADRVYPHIITPNNDGLNDIFWVFYANPMDSEVQGMIYDIDGAEVAEMAHVSGAEEYSISWDGKDGSGNAAPGGVYVYQISAEGKIYNGTVVVAR